MKTQRTTGKNINREGKAFSVQGFADFLGCSDRLIWKFIREKALGHVRIGGRVIILPSQVDDFLLRHSIDALQ